MKRCIQCGKVYADEWIYCDQDGSRLRRKRRMLPYGIAAAAVLALATAALAVPPLVRKYLQGHVSVQLKDIGLHANASFGWPPLRPYADVVLAVRNTAPISPKLHSVRLRCAVGGQSLAALEWPGAGQEPLAIAGGQETEVKLKLTPQAADVGHVIQDLPQNHEVLCAGPVVVSLWQIDVSSEIEVKTQLW